MSLVLRISCLALLLGALAAAENREPAPAHLIPASGAAPMEVAVVEETLSGVTVIVGDVKDVNAMKTTFPPGKYHLDYNRSQNRDLLAAMEAESRKPDEALTLYSGALTTSRFDWERQAAYLGIARLAEPTKKYEVGIQAMQSFQKDYPRAALLPEALYLLGHDLALNKDIAGATKVLTDLKGHEKDWGIGAAIKGSVGLAQMLQLDGKPADAITELKQWGPDRLQPDKDPEDFANVFLTLASIQASQKDPAAADTYRQVAYSPCPAAIQAQAQLGWASALADKGDPNSLLNAFDHAAITAVLHGADPQVRGDAIRLAESLVPKIVATGADDASKNKFQVEYKAYLSKLLK